MRLTGWQLSPGGPVGSPGPGAHASQGHAGVEPGSLRNGDGARATVGAASTDGAGAATTHGRATGATNGTVTANGGTAGDAGVSWAEDPAPAGSHGLRPLVGDDALFALLAAALYGDGRPPGAGSDGTVTVELDGALVRASPAHPAAPGAPADRLVIDARRPAVDWAWLGRGGVPAGGADVDARLSGWLAALIDGGEGRPGLTELRNRLAELDARLADAEAAERERPTRRAAGGDADTATGGRAGGALDAAAAWPDRAAAAAGGGPWVGPAEVVSEARSRTAALDDLAAQLAELDDDLAATEATLAEARRTAAADQAEAAATAAASDDGPARPSAVELTRMASGLEHLADALAERDGAWAELVAASNTAAVLRRAISRAPRPPRRWVALLQPIVLAAAALLVLVAVVLLLGGNTGSGLVVAALAVLAGLLALATPTRTTGGGVDAQRLRGRLAQADADAARWQLAVQRAQHLMAQLAHAIDVPADLTPAEIEHRIEDVNRLRHARHRRNGRDRRGEVARNTAVAAAERTAALRAERDGLTARVEALRADWSRWCSAHGVPSWMTPTEADEHYGARAEGRTPPSADPAELRQARQAVADQLTRLSWESDRIALARSLLVRGQVADRAAALLALGTGGRWIGIEPGPDGLPRMQQADGRWRTLADAPAGLGATPALCVALAAAEREAARGGWPVLVRRPDPMQTPSSDATGPDGATHAMLDRLLAEVARRVEVLVVSPGAVGAPSNGAGGAPGASGDRPGIRVLVTPAE